MSKFSFFQIFSFELKTQIRTKSFWLLSLLPPIAIVLLFMVNINSQYTNTIIVINNTGIEEPIGQTPRMKVQYIDVSIDTESYLKKHTDIDAFINLSSNSSAIIQCDVYEKRSLLPENIQAISSDLKSKIVDAKFGEELIKAREAASEAVKIQHYAYGEENAALTGLSIVSVFLIYLVILQFASSILRATGREKKNKICEILLSSMSSFDIMTGKLIAGLMTAILQIALWIGIGVVCVILLDFFSVLSTENEIVYAIFEVLRIIPLSQLMYFVIVFMLLIMGGYLLYAILFSVLGSISNENTNTHQFSLVVTIPLLLTFVYVSKNFHSDTMIMQFLSFLPLSSPIALLTKLANGASAWIVISSIALLYLTVGITLFYSCILYEKGSMSGSSKITLSTLFNWIKPKK